MHPPDSIQTAVRRQFDHDAHRYDRHAEIQDAVADHLLSLLPQEQPTPPRAIEIGCGTGLLTRRVLERWPSTHLDAIDLSPGMIAEARRSLPPALGGRVRWHCADAARWESPVVAGALISSSTLHWIPDLTGLLLRMTHTLAPGARLGIALFLEGTLHELHQLHSKITPHSPPPPRLPASASVQDALHDAGWIVDHQEQRRFHQFYSSPRELFRHLRDQGLNAGFASARRTRGELHRLSEAYRAAHDSPRGVAATFHAGFFLARTRDPS